MGRSELFIDAQSMIAGELDVETKFRIEPRPVTGDQHAADFRDPALDLRTGLSFPTLLIVEGSSKAGTGAHG